MAFRAALKRAGITDFTFHDLCHTYASHFVMAGSSLKTLREHLGHTTIAMTMKFAYLAPEHKLKEAARLNGLIGRVSPMSQNVILENNKKISNRVSC